MNKRMISLLALLLACLMIITACGKKPGTGDGPEDPNQQQGSSGNTGNNQGGSGSDSSGGTDDPSGGGSASGDAREQKLGTVDGVEYRLIEFQRDASSNDATRYQLNAVSGTALSTTVIYATAGELDYAVGSLEQSGNTALYFTVAESKGGPATLYCYDLYSKEVQQVLAAPCSNMVVFDGSGQFDGYGWVLQDDYVMAIDLKNQTADMTMAASTMELSGFSSVGGSFFGNQQSASIKESEYGVLEVTLQRGSSLLGYLYTCDTFTAVELK